MGRVEENEMGRVEEVGVGRVGILRWEGWRRLRW